MDFNFEPSFADREGYDHIKMIAKVLALSIVLVLLFGCTPRTTEVTNNYTLTADLKDCKIHELRSGGGSNITVVRCPNSSTTMNTGGKNPKTSIVIDGVEYEAVKKE